MTNTWPSQGPASYFPSIEKKYGTSIAEWEQIIDACGLEKHMTIVNFLKAEYAMDHGNANALVRWTLAGNVAKEELHAQRDLNPCCRRERAVS